MREICICWHERVVMICFLVIRVSQNNMYSLCSIKGVRGQKSMYPEGMYTVDWTSVFNFVRCFPLCLSSLKFWFLNKNNKRTEVKRAWKKSPLWTLASAEGLRNGWAGEQRLVEDSLRQIQRRESLACCSSGRGSSCSELEPVFCLEVFQKTGRLGVRRERITLLAWGQNMLETKKTKQCPLAELA